MEASRLEPDQASDREGEGQRSRKTLARSDATPNRIQPVENRTTLTSQAAISRLSLAGGPSTSGVTCAIDGTAKPSNHMSPARPWCRRRRC
jgi:hypothetical protein